MITSTRIRKENCMEKKGYRENLEMLLTVFAPTEWLTQKKIADAMSIDVRTVKARFGVDRNGISVADLARRMTK